MQARIQPEVIARWEITADLPAWSPVWVWRVREVVPHGTRGVRSTLRRTGTAWSMASAERQADRWVDREMARRER